MLLDGLAALISVPVWVYLGYLGADNKAWLSTWIHRGQNGLWLLLGAAIVAAVWMWLRGRQRRACKAAETDRVKRIASSGLTEKSRQKS